MKRLQLSSSMLPLVAGAAVAGALQFAAASNAEAAFKMELSDGTVTKTIEDNMAGDLLPLVTGQILFSGAVGVFTVSVEIGKSKPIVGSATNPVLELVSINTMNTAPGTLTMKITDTGFGPTLSPLTFDNVVNSASATTGTVSFSSFIDNGNIEFGEEQLIAALGPASGTFNIGGTGTVNPGIPFSLTMKVALTHTVANQSSQFDASVRVPEPSSLALFAIGLLGLGLARRRMQGKAVRA